MKEKQSKICIPMNWHIATDVERINPFGYQLKTYLVGDETIAHFLASFKSP